MEGDETTAPSVIGAEELELEVPRGRGCSPTAESSEEEQVLIWRAKAVSWTSIALSVVIGVAGLAVGLEDGALAIAGLGGETLLDAISSIMVLWRFKKGKARTFQDEQEAEERKAARDALRERHSALGIGGGFVAFAALLLALAATHVHLLFFLDAAVEEKELKGVNMTLFIAWPSFVLFVVLALLKWRLARQLDSLVLRQDALCTAFGAFLAVVTAIAATIEEVLDEKAEGNLAFGLIDPLVSGFIAVLMMAEGVRTLRHNWRPGDRERTSLTASAT